MDDKLMRACKNKIHNKLDGTKVYDSYQFKAWRHQNCEFTLGNTRVVKVQRHIPVYKKGAKGDIHYSVEMIGEYRKDHLTIEELAEVLVEWGNANKNFVNKDLGAKHLKDMGFVQAVPKEEPTISDIAFNLSEGVWEYRLVVDESTKYFGPEYDTGVAPYYYGSRYEDVFKREYMEVRHGDGEWYKVAYREVKVGSHCISNYVGD